MITLEVMTPEAMLLSETVLSVTLPGTVSPFQVLPGHAPIITSLSAGKILYRLQGGEESSLAVGAGFALVEDDIVKVCVEG